VTTDRFVVLGLAHVRSRWSTDVARWATAGSIPVEFVKCVSVEELRARLAGGRPFSAALLDARLPAVDRDLVATLVDAGVPALVVDGPGGPRWSSLGAAAVVAAPPSRPDLVAALTEHCRPIGSLDPGLDHHDGAVVTPTTAAWRGRLVAVTGRPGAGTSTIACALAQSLAEDPRYAGDVVLADLARYAHQALLHDARDVVPGIQELVEAHRSGQPSPDQVRALGFEVPTRGYRLILGLRRPSDWVTVRSRAFAATLDGLRRSARIVVADLDADLEGESDTGSFDVEDRNLMARTATAQADLVVVVGTPTTTGIHGLVTQIEDLRNHGVPGHRLLVVVNRAPRAPRARAELAATIAALTGAGDHADPHAGPTFVPLRRGVDAAHRDLARVPTLLAEPAGRAVRYLLDRLPGRDDTATEPQPVAVVPGSLGSWSDDQEATS
jgi:MinD-like ATPase involved in chromosome partitioning or flagellar assembly